MRRRYLWLGAFGSLLIIGFEGFFRKALSVFLSLLLGINSITFGFNIPTVPSAVASTPSQAESLIADSQLLGEMRLKEVCLPFVGCRKIPIPGAGRAIEGAINKKIQRSLLEVVRKDIPIELSTDNLYPTVNRLPGAPFQPSGSAVDPKEGMLGVMQQMLMVAPDGRVELMPGDYAAQVYLYCYKPNAPGVPTQQYRSPRGHRYQLASMKGKAANAIRALNIAALGTDVSNRTINMLVWNIQAGVKYEDMDPKLKALVDELIPEHREALSQSFFENAVSTWNKFSRINRKLPSFEKALGSLGEVGSMLQGTMAVRQNLIQHGVNYFALSDEFIIPDNTGDIARFEDVPWSRINERMFARLVTKGRTAEMGSLQIRVLPEKKSSTPKPALFVEEVEGLGNASFVSMSAAEKQAKRILPEYGDVGVLLLDSSELSEVDPQATKQSSKCAKKGYKQLTKTAVKGVIKVGLKFVPVVGWISLVSDAYDVYQLVFYPEDHPDYYVQPSSPGFQGDIIDPLEVTELDTRKACSSRKKSDCGTKGQRIVCSTSKDSTPERKSPSSNQGSNTRNISKREQQRLDDLKKDPSHGGKITANSKREAEVGLALEKRGQLSGPIKRDPEGRAEFIDANGQLWDMKSFNSNFPTRKGGFELERDVSKITDELRRGENVILDIRDLSDIHKVELRQEIERLNLLDRVIFYP